MSGPGPGEAPHAGPGTIARVSVDSPLPQLDHLFDYAIPPQLADQVTPGVRVRVPLRTAGRIADGYVIELAETSSAPGRLSALDSVVSSVPVLTPEVWRLARAVADRSAGVASDVLRIAIPKRQVRVEKAWLAGHALTPSGSSTGSSPSASTGVSSGPSSGPPSDASAPAAAPAADATSAHVALPVVGRLLRGARIAAEATPAPADLPSGPVGSWAIELAQVAAGVIAAGRSAIVAVPDQRDLDQLVAALAAGPADGQVVRVDAAQPPAARYRAHLTALGSGPRIVVGNRSAVYAPAPALGAILVWEEADPFHREPLAPYASTRDVALLRQEQSGAGLLLLAHARSSTVERLVQVGWVAGSPPPRATPRVVLTPDDDRPSRIPSAAWRDLGTALADGPVLVQVARPGDAALHALRQRRSATAPMTATEPDPVDAIPPVDAGRTAHDLGRAFPGVPVVVADGDHPHATVPPEPAVVVATRGAEPRTEGGYRAVLLLDGRRMLARESLWVAEDCLRWWSNAASLAAPGAPVHLVGVQGDVALALATWRSPDFAAAQLADRRALRFPPATRLALLTGSRPAVEELVVELRGVGADPLARMDDAEGGPQVVVRFDYAAGPAVAAAAKAAAIRAAAVRRGPPAPGRRPARTLRVRFDVQEPLPS